MKSLVLRTAQEAYERHWNTPVRVYEDDGAQRNRILTARGAVTQALAMLRGQRTHHEPATIIELGAGMADISGYFSWGHRVICYESASHLRERVMRRFPYLQEVRDEDIQTAPPQESDLLIICEILEHVADPLALCRAWLPLAKYCVLSSPLDGDLQGDASGGEHMWSFDEHDFKEFAEAGGHEIVKAELVPMGLYTINLLLTRQKEVVGEQKAPKDIQWEQEKPGQ